MNYRPFTKSLATKLLAPLLVVAVADSLTSEPAYASGMGDPDSISFSRIGALGDASSVGAQASGTPVVIREPGFRTPELGVHGSGQIEVPAMDGRLVASRSFSYPSSLGAGARPENHLPSFAASKDVLVMDNADVVLTLGQEGFLTLAGGHLVLMDSHSHPLLELNADYDLISSLQSQFKSDGQNATSEAELREEWLSWTNWTAPFIPSTKLDQQELKNLRTLQTLLRKAGQRISGVGSPGEMRPNNATLLFVGCYLYDNKIQFQLPGNKIATYQAGSVVSANGTVLLANSSELKTVLQSVLRSLQESLKVDIRLNASQRSDLATDALYIREEVQNYSQYASYYGWNYRVDFGPSEIPASTAYQYAMRDDAANQAMVTQNRHDAEQLHEDVRRVNSAVAWLK